MSRKNHKRNTQQARNRLRIIGGDWRGRRLEFANTAGIRPTPDRVRETLFNWLQTSIIGARCLDMFAGSGALGLEALSRGAGQLVFVEQSPAAVSSIRENLAALDARAQVFEGDAFDFLRGNTDTFDVVFVDPPFGEGLQGKAIKALSAGHALADNARIYLESGPGELEQALPPDFVLLRRGRAGRVEFGLAARSG